jgi:hypothetical protein
LHEIRGQHLAGNIERFLPGRGHIHFSPFLVQER